MAAFAAGYAIGYFLGGDRSCASSLVFWAILRAGRWCAGLRAALVSGLARGLLPTNRPALVRPSAKTPAPAWTPDRQRARCLVPQGRRRRRKAPKRQLAYRTARRPSGVGDTPPTPAGQGAPGEGAAATDAASVGGGAARSAPPWSNMSGRTFRRWLESLETQAAQNAGAGRLSADQTRALLAELRQQGWTIPRRVETEWVGGSHINIIGPDGGPNIHLPVPPGFVP